MTLLELLIEALRVALLGRRHASANSVQELETVRTVDTVWCDLLHVGASVDSALVESVLRRGPKGVQREDYHAKEE